MKLYHGTNTDFCEILLSRCRPNKDFGQGFYLTDIRSQAEAMAVRRCEFEESGVPIVQEYEFDEANLYMQHLITMETLVKELTYRQLNNQYFFGTERAIQQLRRV